MTAKQLGKYKQKGNKITQNHYITWDKKLLTAWHMVLQSSFSYVY